MKCDVLVLGSATQDIFIKARGITGGSIPLGEKFDADEVVKTPGGGGINAAIGLARHGYRVGLVSRVGSDTVASELEAELRREDVSADIQKDTMHPTATSYIIVAPSGERTIFQNRGANDYLEEPRWDAFDARWLYIIDTLGTDDLAIIERAMEWAEHIGARVAVTPDKHLLMKREELVPILARAAVVFVNEREAALLAGREYSEEAEREVLAELQSRIGTLVVMTLGPRGVLATDGARSYSAGIPDSPVVDRTGAGDAFGSGFVAEYIRNGDVDAAIASGTANATSVIQYFGAIRGLLRV